MENKYFEAQVMWSQIDANMHLRHSAYADFAAQARLVQMETMGFNARTMKELHLGPILFREELIYRKEVRPNEKIKVSTLLSKTREDGSRWSLRHEILKENGELAAIVNVDGAWIDVLQRKLGSLPQEYAKIFLTMSKTDDFVME
jgi:acyl-CoA thioester hydrolase